MEKELKEESPLNTFLVRSKIFVQYFWLGWYG